MKKVITLFTLVLFVISADIKSQITSYPYVQTGDNISGWSVNQSVLLWYLGNSGKNPANVSNDFALVCNFYAHTSGVNGMVISPVFDFSSLTKPMLNFYLAHKSHVAENDSLYLLISTDGGSTYSSILYARAFNSTPSLSTLPPQVQQFNPSSPNHWRHETIDLTAYAGMNNVRFAFKGVSDYGNDLWVDNFIIANADQYCTNTVSSPGVYMCNAKTEVDMNTVGRPAPGNYETEINNEESRDIKNNTSIASLLPVYNGGKIREKYSVNQYSLENPSGGVLSVTEHSNQNPPSNSSPVIEINTTALNAGGTITNPNVIYHDYWFTVTYTGNDRFGYANYDISIDVTYFTNRSSLYIVKRADMTAPWVCLNTSEVGNNLVSSGLTTFSDFALAGDSILQPLPVELASFTATINHRNVTLNWATSSELNNSGFDIERSNDGHSWVKVGNVTGNGTSSNMNYYSFTDRGLNSGLYNYRLKQTDFNGNFEYFNLSSDVNIGVPLKFDLAQNYPNPFNPSTQINYDIPYDSKVTIKVFDISGKEVMTLVNEYQTAGYYTITLNASSVTGGLSSGVYFYNIYADGSGSNYRATKKMILIK